MERADWLDEGFDSAQARFLMLTAITHHHFSSPLWAKDEVRRLQAELAEIDQAVERVEAEYLRAQPGGGSSLSDTSGARSCWPSEEEEEIPGLWRFFN
ncbi:MAG: hypothetical protein M3133_01490 [Actinomycetota bacterium]|nr:hypothetical protein [Actinomycetota bacterium]